MALKLLLYLNVKAQAIPKIFPSKKIIHKATQKEITVRGPLILNHERTYKMKDGSTQTGIKQDGHWRRGHFRGVWKGAGRSILEDKWIEPYPVGSCREDEPEE